jgi:hypothetical protein
MGLVGDGRNAQLGDADHGRDDTYHGTVGQGSIEELADKVARESRLPDINLLEMD